MRKRQTRKVSTGGGSLSPGKNHGKKNTTRKAHSTSPKKEGCPPGMDNEDCLEHKIKVAGYTRLESPDDGNCFFTSLETYFKLKETPLADKDNMELRQDLVDYLLAHVEKFRPFVVKEYKVKSEKQRLRYLDAFITKQIKELGKSYVYDTDLGDIVPQEATNAFNVQIVIHNWRWRTLDFALFDLKPDEGAGSHTIHILRINENHFDLLYPTREFDVDAQERWEMIKMIRSESDNNTA